MKVKILNEAGFEEALFGLGFSHGLTSCQEFTDRKKSHMDRMYHVALRLCGKGQGHDKFLRQIAVWIDITAPLYWWPQFDQYKVAVVTQSESRMHTLLNEPIRQDKFASPVCQEVISLLEEMRKKGDFSGLVNALPGGWLQRRVVSANYANLYNIIHQRKGHKLKEWDHFIDQILQQCKYPELLYWERKQEGIF